MQTASLTRCVCTVRCVGHAHHRGEVRLRLPLHLDRTNKGLHTGAVGAIEAEAHCDARLRESPYIPIDDATAEPTRRQIIIRQKRRCRVKPVVVGIEAFDHSKSGSCCVGKVDDLQRDLCVAMYTGRVDVDSSEVSALAEDYNGTVDGVEVDKAVAGAVCSDSGVCAQHGLQPNTVDGVNGEHSAGTGNCKAQ